MDKKLDKHFSKDLSMTDKHMKMMKTSVDWLHKGSYYT